MIEFDGERIYTVPEVARIVGRCRGQVYAWLAAGRLPARMVAGRTYVAGSDLSAFLLPEPEGARPVPTSAARKRRAAKAVKVLEARGW